jgi:TfoX/Sxy family transcriptional regulator of competence genes
MTYDPRLFERVQDALARKDGWTEKEMFGGRVCLRNGRPFVGTISDGVIALCDEASREKHLQLKHCSPFVYKGKEQPGWIKVSLDALKTAKQLSRWVEASYNLAGTLPPAAGKAKAGKR